MYRDDEILGVKKAFALAFLRFPTDPMRAAQEVESRPNYAIWIANSWQFDDEVQAFMREAREDRGLQASIPTKDEFAATLYRDAQTMHDKELKLDYYKLLAQVMGYIEKPATNVINNNNNNVDNRSVIVLPATNQNMDDWEKVAEQNQAKLIEYSAG